MKTTKKVLSNEGAKKIKEEVHYCPILDELIDMSNCIELKAIIDGEILDDDKNSIYAKAYELKNYDIICTEKCRQIKFCKSKESYLKSTKNKKSFLEVKQ